MSADPENGGEFSVPDSLAGEDGLVVLNPSAIGNPDEDPRVWVGANGVALLQPCRGDATSRGGYCGGVNGFHAEDCPEATR